jgi:hypothetical protein
MGAFSISAFQGNPGHMAGTLNGVNVESRGGDGVVVGGSARGARDGMFSIGPYHLVGLANGGRVGDLPYDIFNRDGKYFLDPKALYGNIFDNGGLLQPGLSLTYNGTGQPERVLTPAATEEYERGSDIDYSRLAAAILAGQRDMPERIGREVGKHLTKGGRA